MPQYDFIIAGGGAAGLSLAYQLQLSPLRNKSILVIDKDDDDQLQRNWGYWSNRPTLFDAVPHHTWNQLDVIGAGSTQRIPLGDYQYHLMHGAHFYRFVLETLAACPNVTFVRGVIHHIDEADGEGEGGARVMVDDTTYTGRWVFDSVVRPGELKREVQRYQFLRMHFKGWDLETPSLAFDPRAARLFDFRTPQPGSLCFFYLMPYSECHAFVEYTVFSPNVLNQEQYEAALRGYVETTLGIRDYTITSEENGAIPLTDYPFTRRAGEHIMTLGAKGGRVKPTTGYSFMRVQHDAERIVRSLLDHGHPFDVPPDPPFFRFCDSLLLTLMRQHGEQIAPIYLQLFRNNPIQRVLRFLDEQSSPSETLALIASLPPRYFLQSLLRHLTRS